MVGSSLRLNGVEFKIVGVASEQFTGVEQMVNPALFVPLAMAPRLGSGNILEKRDARWLTVKGRLKPGANIAQANAMGPSPRGWYSSILRPTATWSSRFRPKWSLR